MQPSTSSIVPDSHAVPRLKLSSRSTESFHTGHDDNDNISTATAASLQSLFVPSLNNRSSHSPTLGGGSGGSINGSHRSKRSTSNKSLQLQGQGQQETHELKILIPSAQDDDEKEFEEYKSNYPLHCLAATGNLTKLESELRNIKDLESFTRTDEDCRTILHAAAIFHGNGKKSIQIILDAYKHLILQQVNDQSKWSLVFGNFVNYKDVNCQTALYLAAKNENIKMCKELLLNNADWDIKSIRSKTPIQKMFKKTPIVIKKTLLKFATKSSSYKNETETIVKLDFGPIIGYPSPEENEKNANWIYEEAHLLSNLCYTKVDERKFILNHTLVKIFIWLKWQKFQYFFWLIVFLPVVRLLLYFWFLIRVYRKDCPYDSEDQIEFQWINLRPLNLTHHSNNGTIDHHHCYKTAVVTAIGWFLLTVSIFDLILFDAYPTMIAFRRHWCPMKTRNLHKYIKRTRMFISSIGIPQYIEFSAILINVLPSLGYSIISPGNEAQYIIASIGVFFAWFHIFHQLGRIPLLKVYVDMFGTILFTLFDVAFMYIAIICAFAMVFCILLPGIGSYSSLTQALLKISTFLIGEIEYETIFYSEDSNSISASLGTTMIFYVLAILVLHVALLNFLVGLTVADIQRMYEDSSSKKDFCKIWQISIIETFLSCAPRTWGVPLLKYMRIQTGRKICDEEGFILQLYMKELPKKFQKDLRALLLKQKHKLMKSSGETPTPM